MVTKKKVSAGKTTAKATSKTATISKVKKTAVSKTSNKPDTTKKTSTNTTNTAPVSSSANKKEVDKIIPINEMENKITSSDKDVTIIKKEKSENIISEVKKMIANVSRKNEIGIVNKASGSSMTVRKDGYTSMVANDKTQFKLDSSGKSMDMTQESIVMANRRTLEIEDLVINNHKMNPLILNYTDGVSVLDDEKSFVSRYRTSGTVIVKAWDTAKKSYTFIRRPAAMALFSPRLNTAQIPEDLGVSDSIKQTIEDITNSNQSVTKGIEKEPTTTTKTTATNATASAIKKATSTTKTTKGSKLKVHGTTAKTVSKKTAKKSGGAKSATKTTSPLNNVTANGTPITRGVASTVSKKNNKKDSDKSTASKTDAKKAATTAKAKTKAKSATKKSTAKKATTGKKTAAKKANAAAKKK